MHGTWKRGAAVMLSVVLAATGCFLESGETSSAGAKHTEGKLVQSVFKSAEKDTATGIYVNTPTQQEIKERVAAIEEVFPSFSENPVLDAPYSAGALSGDTLENALETLNLVRFIAGVPDQVTLNTEYSELAQAAALVNYVNGVMSHTPAKPAGMDDALYQLGKEGAGSSNLGSGWGTGSYYKNGMAFYQEIIHGWMYDGKGNMSTVGHRRWILNPSMEQTGFGAVWGSDSSGNSFQNAMYAFDNSFGSTDYYGVAWPAQNMPVSFFGADYPWSISMGKDVPDDVTVTLQKRGGSTWEFTKDSEQFYINNSYYGQKGCIIFLPSGIESYENGDIYDVSIQGTGLAVTYTVKFFDISSSAEDSPGESSDAATEKPASTPVVETPETGATKEPQKLDTATDDPDIEASELPAAKTALPEIITTSLPAAKTISPVSSAIPAADTKTTPAASQGPETSAGKTTAPTQTAKPDSATETPESEETETASEQAASVKKPGKVSIQSVKNKKGKKVVVKWNKIAGVNGYQIQYALNSSFSKGKKSKMTTNVSYTVKSLKKKKTYYIRVRAYKKQNSGKLYGAWSTVKKIKIKK